MEYEGTVENEINVFGLLRSRYTLLYSKVHEEWNQNHRNYNCYAYAINKKDSSKAPGYMIGASVNISTLQTMTISRLATLIKYDLQELGYTNIEYGYNVYATNSGYRVIAIRKCDVDYHVMYMESSGVWLHKPGTSAILKYNYSSLTQGIWTNEYNWYGYDYKGTNEYDSDIIYIRYKL